jgi:PAS domain S-box-containing protein
MTDDASPRHADDTSALAESAAVLRSLVDAAVDAIIIIDQSGTVLSFNPGAERMFGYPPGEVIGRNVNILMPEPYHSQHDGYLARFHRTGERRIIGIGREVEGRRKDGTVFPIDLAVSEVHVDGRVLYSGIARDLSPIRAADDALRQSEESLRLLVEGVADHAMILLEPDGRIAAWNAGAERMFGYPGDAIVGRAVSALHPADDPAEPLLAEAFSYGTVDTRARRVRADGTEFEAHVVLSAVYAHDGSLRAFANVVRDITQQKAQEARQEAFEEQLRQAQRLESVGQLAGGVAHDFNNLLSVVLGSVTLLEGSLRGALEGAPQRDRVMADLHEIEEAARRGAALTRQLLTFSRKDVIAPQVVDLDEVVDGVTGMLRRTIGEHIELQFVVDREARWPVLVDRGQLEQVLVNLAVNARDAMPDGGTLTVETRNVHLDEAFLQPEARATSGPYAVLIVSDTGVGMAPDVAARAFEPFFTTKSPGSGTGLGLATIYGIVTGAGGVVRLYSEPGIGTAVKVYFPATTAALSPTPIAPREAEPRWRDGDECVLLVEDEHAVRELARRLLTDAGYRVIAAANGPEAIEQYDAHRDDIALLLTDLIMPGMSGRDLAQHVRALDPRLPVLYMSGYTAGLLGPRAILGDGDRLLEKPFTRAMLLGKVDAALGANDVSGANDTSDAGEVTEVSRASGARSDHGA